MLWQLRIWEEAVPNLGWGGKFIQPGYVSKEQVQISCEEKGDAGDVLREPGGGGCRVEAVESLGLASRWEVGGAWCRSRVSCDFGCKVESFL